MVNSLVKMQSKHAKSHPFCVETPMKRDLAFQNCEIPSEMFPGISKAVGMHFRVL